MKIPLWETHWFQLKNSTLLELEDGLLRELVSKGIAKAGNLHKLCKKLDLSSPTFYNFMNNKRDHKMISVIKLTRLLSYLDIDPSTINDKIKMTKKGKVISISNPKFPINLNNKYGAYLLGLIVSDGCIYFDKKSRNQTRTKYAAGEKKSVTNFVKVLYKIYGKVHFQDEFVRNCNILRIGTSIVGDSLLKVGAVSGRKAKADGDVPWLVRQGTKEMKIHYLRAAFDDESCVYKEKTRNCGYITLSRYRHLTNLTQKQKDELHKIESLMSSRAFPTGHINKTIPLRKAVELLNDKELIKELGTPSRLLQGESKILNELGIDNRFFGRCLTKTHSGRYSICFDMFINRKASLTKFYKQIGYSLDRKQQKLIHLVGGDNAVKALQHPNKKEASI